MSRITIMYPSSTELGTQYTATPVSLSETDAIVITSLSSSGTQVAEVGGNTQGTLYIKTTRGSATAILMRLYGSYVTTPTSNDWFQETVETDASGVATLDPFSITTGASTTISYHFPIGAYKALKWTVQATGGTGVSVVTLNCGLRIN